ncbi:hypothetical protein BC941DRAFT_439405 [Chlamydoabsidia padenii]|nr:hypothetical protein BC941DRAFT_439405 [Chlamydoabsidia padenii]
MIMNNTWFYIQSTETKHVISASRRIHSEGLDSTRSQVHVYAPLRTDEELWTWEGQFIRNKATGLVLDIRKGRLRLIEDTEICLYRQKPLEEASNQLWGIRDTPQGKLIYSISNTEWTLMQDGDKLLLYPQEPHHDTWDCIGEHDLLASTTMPCATTPPDLCSAASSFETEYTQGGLSPAKRGSQGSVSLYSMDSFKDYHDRLYLEQDTHLR